MTASADMLHSLGFYVHLKMVAGVAKDDCQQIADYHVFLQNVEAQAGASAMLAGFSAEHPLISLADITLTQLQYSDVVDQIYDGHITFMCLSLSLQNLPSCPLGAFIDAKVAGKDPRFSA